MVVYSTDAGRLNPRTSLVFIDFDGTLAQGDSLLPFLHRVEGSRRALLTAVARASVHVARQRRMGRNALKELLLRECVVGRSKHELCDIGTIFAQHLVDQRLFADAVQELERHRQDGAKIVLVSASLDVYLEPLRALMAFDAVLCTQIEYDSDRQATGNFIGANVRRAEKVRMAIQWMADNGLERDTTVITAYGNGSGDGELLAFADLGLLRSRRLLRRTGAFAAHRGSVEDVDGTRSEHRNGGQ